jgi:hypothetical protein
MFGRRQPLLDVGAEVLDRHPALRREYDLEYLTGREPSDGLRIAGENSLEGFAVSQFRLLRDERPDAIEAIDDLRIDRVLDPERAVLIERGDALLRPQVAWARGVRCGAYEIEDRVFRGPVVPRR